MPQFAINEQRWNFEGIAFGAVLPVNEQCGDISPIRVFRAFNDQAGSGNSNHRFTADLTLYRLMLRLGWKPEGVAMCVQSLTAPAL